MLKLLTVLASLLPLGVGADLPQASPVPGGIAIVLLGPANIPPPVAQFRNERVLVTQHDGHWHAVVGLPLTLAPGQHWLQISDEKGSRRQAFAVTSKTYETQHITIKDRRMVEPTASDLKRIERDRKVIGQALATWTAGSAPELRFDVPVQGRLSSRFGLRRYFNDQPRAPHSGLDLAAPEGTAITAPAAGHLDHGQGLITLYNHLRRIAVVPGEIVTRGQKIGEVGMTGRVTGPHLHWAVSLNHALVDPSLFLSPEFLADRIGPTSKNDRQNGQSDRK